MSLVVLPSCAGDPGSGLSPATTVPQSAGSVVDGFSAPTIDGGTFNLGDELASKPVALWFWAPG